MVEPICIKHSSGAFAIVHPFGATITSFQTSIGREVLFVSSLAKFDGSRPIRGGIPLVFPQFGQPDKSMPQHGILRNRLWNVGSAYHCDEDDSSCCELHVSFPHDSDINEKSNDIRYVCNVTLLVKVQPSTLTAILTVLNPNDSQQDFDFQALFHTYYRVEGSKALQNELCNVRGLSGYHVFDQITKEAYVLEEDAVVSIDREVDRIYTPDTSQDQSLELRLKTGTNEVNTIVQASALVNGIVAPVSVVVWNPFIEKSKGMADFGNDEYHDMICVEPGMLTNIPTLKSGGTAVFKQVITSV